MFLLGDASSEHMEVYDGRPGPIPYFFYLPTENNSKREEEGTWNGLNSVLGVTVSRQCAIPELTWPEDLL